MKKILLFILLPILSIGQTKIGIDIDGEAAGDNSGYRVSLSKDGSTLAVGAIYNNGGGSDAGSVRVYKNISGIWTKIGADIDGEKAGDLSGNSISLSDNGSILAIGSYHSDGKGSVKSESGSVRVYEYITETWKQIGTDIDGESGRNGTSISLSSDGTILAIGAPYDDNGTVRVYKNISGTWTQIGDNIKSVYGPESNSGWSISLSSNGNIVAIGNDNQRGGAVRVFEYVSGAWTKIGNTIFGETVDDYNGYSISLSSDGSILAIGVPSNNGGGGSGAVRVYKNVLETWTQIGADIYGETAGDSSGRSVSLSSDGTILAIGAPYNIDKGSVRVYKNISETWTKIGFDIDGERSGDSYGYSVSLSGDGSILAIGAPRNNGNGYESGSVRMYNLSTVLSSDSFVMGNFLIYPNPVSEVVTINLQKDLKLEKLNIYNTLGQLVRTETKNVISVNSLTKGTYFFEVITDKGKATKTILVQK